MRQIKSFFLTAVMLFTALSFNSCDKDGNLTACGKVLLADLAFETTALVEPAVAIGAKLVLNNVITNLESECDREIADASYKKTNAYYRETENDPWETVQFQDNNGTVTYDVIVGTGALAEGEEEERNEEYNFSTEGQYRFELAADTYNNVNEENEDNNGAGSGTGTVSKSYNETNNELIVTVYDPTKSGKYKRVKGEPVIVQYLGSELVKN